MSGAARATVAVIGATGRLGSLARKCVEASPDFELVGAFGSGDDWPAALAAARPALAFEATRAGLGAEHGRQLLELGIRPVIGTSGVAPEESDALDRLARARGLGGLVVPNFSLGALLLQRFAVEAARHFPDVEIVELHHERKTDAPSGTAAETARRVAAARRAPATAPDDARGVRVDGVPIHSVRLPGLYAHQEVLFGAAGELLTLRHDMSGPAAFAPGILAALAHARTAVGVARGLEVALAP